MENTKITITVSSIICLCSLWCFAAGAPMGINTNGIAMKVVGYTGGKQVPIIHKMTLTNHASMNSSNNANIVEELEGIKRAINGTHNPVSDITIGALVAALGLLGGTLAVDRIVTYWRRPRLFLDKSNSPLVKGIDIAIYDIKESIIPSNLRKFTLRYRVNRVLIRNDGPQAARNCKGILSKDSEELKVCWSIPSERYRMTVNAHSMEYLDLCGVLDGEASTIHTELQTTLSELKKHVDGFHDVSLRTPLSLEIDEYIANNKSVEDIPLIIAPTENGWEAPQLNHILLRQSQLLNNDSESTTNILKGNFKIIVTAENAKGINEGVTISSSTLNKNGEIVTFSNKERKV